MFLLKSYQIKSSALYLYAYLELQKTKPPLCWENSPTIFLMCCCKFVFKGKGGQGCREY
jgi:hypothetical protein